MFSSVRKQNLPLMDYTEINKLVETGIAMCSFQLKYALFIAVEALPHCNKTKSPLSTLLQPLTYAETALCGTSVLCNVCPDSKGKEKETESRGQFFQEKAHFI